MLANHMVSDTPRGSERPAGRTVHQKVGGVDGAADGAAAAMSNITTVIDFLDSLDSAR